VTTEAEPRGTPHARPVRYSATEMTEIVLPQHANAIGTVFGGTVMAWTDVCAAIAAQRHCGRVAVTAAVDDLVFLAPLRVGDVVRLTSHVNAAFRSSLEVEVKVEREDSATMQRTLCVTALLTFVAVADDGVPCRVPPLALETDAERARAKDAEERRAARLSRKSKGG